jgi:multidrug efflux pump subunit AcrB
MSFNVMTLGGMAAAVGLIADDAIVMVEHIMRRLRELGSHNSALRDATLWRSASEFARPLAGSSGATIIIFIPLAFLGGVTGAFFQALALTMASALIISFVIAWLAVPLLTDHLVVDSDLRSDADNWLARAFHPRYRRIMSLLAVSRWMLLGVIATIALIGYIAYRNVGTGFMPHMDEGGFVLDYVAPPGTSLAETDQMLRQAEAILRSDPAVETYSRRTGLQLGGGLTEANQGDFFVRLKPFPRAPIEAVMDRVRTRIQTEIPRLQIDMILLMEDLIGDLTAVPQPIEVKLFGDDLGTLLQAAPQVAARIATIDGVVDVFDGVVLAGDALTIQVDRTKAAFEGIDPAVVADQVALWFTGAVTTELQENVKRVGIRVWTPRQLRDGERSLNDAWVAAPDGHRIPLLRIATVETQTGQPQITRDNLKTMVPVTARISGRDLGSTIANVRSALATPGLLPTGVYFELGGLYAEQQRAFRGLLGVFTTAVMLVFVMLLYLYERFSVALSILLMPLLATSAVFVGLWVTGTELNITAMMGLTMIVGIVTEVSIFYFSEYQELLDQEMPHAAALVQAGVNRMRPILMTTLTAILALLPLALGLGRGAGMQQPLAIAIISGLIVQAPLALIVMPSLFARFSASSSEVRSHEPS